MPLHPSKPGDAPAARPPHPATVAQPKTPHAATVAQPKIPHAATVAQPKIPHAATLRWSEAAALRAARPDALQRMNDQKSEKSDSDGLPWSVGMPSVKHLAGQATKKNMDEKRYSVVLPDVAQADVDFINKDLKQRRDSEGYESPIKIKNEDGAFIFTLPESHGARIYSTHPPKEGRGGGGTTQLFPVSGVGVVTNENGFKIEVVANAGKLVNSKELKGDLKKVADLLLAGRQ